MKRSARPLLAALLLGLAVAQAEEKVLRLYNWADYFAPDTLAAFTRETGIRVVYDVMDSSETLEAKLMSGNSGYDLIFPGDTVAERLMRAGALQKLDPGAWSISTRSSRACANCKPATRVRATPPCPTPGAPSA